jgi:F-type H+-transporting ATPase subunit b
MLALFNSFILLLAEGGHTESGGGGFANFYNEYLNIPGFELWKFINLAIFVGIMVYLLNKPLSEAFKAKRESIRAELIRAEQEKQAALEKLTQAEAKLTQIDSEKANVLRTAEQEAAADAAQLLAQTEQEISRLQQQTGGELSRMAQQIRNELRKLSAEESIRRAEEKLRAQIDAEKDARLVRASIQEIGGLN